MSPHAFHKAAGPTGNTRVFRFRGAGPGAPAARGMEGKDPGFLDRKRVAWNWLALYLIEFTKIMNIFTERGRRGERGNYGVLGLGRSR